MPAPRPLPHGSLHWCSSSPTSLNGGPVGLWLCYLGWVMSTFHPTGGLEAGLALASEMRAKVAQPACPQLMPSDPLSGFVLFHFVLMLSCSFPSP